MEMIHLGLKKASILYVMTSFLKSAKSIHDVESDLAYVEIVYESYKKGKGYTTFTDYMNTSPLGDWTFIQSGKQSIQYEKFLDTMVSNSIEVRQRIAQLALDNVLAYEQSDRNYIRIAHATKILDPTFQPPRVNMESAWQMEFIKKFCKKVVPNVIEQCINKSRLEYFFNILRILELEQ